MNHFKKWIVLLLCAAMIFEIIPFSGKAFDAKKHNQYMFEVLFRNFKREDEISSNLVQKDALTMLEYASYLSIDQFNHKGEEQLRFLLDHGVDNIPATISEMNYQAGGRDHRSYTHRGWDFHYVGVARDLWPIRKSILLATADEIFDFPENDPKKDSFCALIYYIHLIGDHKADKTWKVQNGLKMELGGRIDQEDIIDELIKHFAILFADQKHTHKYSFLVNALTQQNLKLGTLLRSEGGINSDEKFQKKMEYTDEIMKILTLYIPEMLKDELFFNEVFYSE